MPAARPEYDRRVLRIGWQKEQAKLVAQNRVRKSIANREDGPSFVLQVWDYMVEVPGATVSRRVW